MAYSQGTAASFAVIKSAIETACVADGWELVSDVLSKSGCFFKLTASSVKLLLTAGTGQSGSTLTGAGPLTVKIGAPMTVTLPVSYEIHTFNNPLEVICVINHNQDWYQQLSFGKSDIVGIGGTGAFYTGTTGDSLGDTPSALNSSIHWKVTADDFGTSPWGSAAGGLFAMGSAGSHPSSAIHCGLDSVGWLNEGRQDNSGVRGISYCGSLMVALPSLTNSATVLLPVKAVKFRASGTNSVVLNMGNVRYCRNDYLPPGEIVTYGTDKWKVYPFLRRDVSKRNSEVWGVPSPSSGTFAYAVRYLGP